MARRRIVSPMLSALAVAVGSGTLALPAAAGTTERGAGTCTPRVLVLSAMPLELDPLLAHAQADLAHSVMLNDRPFVSGTLEGDQVIMG
ncbi:MAG TPA: hypothetical protein VK428_01475, partial [Acidimicrobiales bacterium]|nr:hypothetical protein [Acidimicrobiales bacterium]